MTTENPNDDHLLGGEQESAEGLRQGSVPASESVRSGDRVKSSGSFGSKDTIAFSSEIDPSMEETGDQADTIDQLVVYLDGQLEGAQREKVESSILGDPELQKHLAGLQESWDALEALPRPEVDEQFTETTVKFVVDAELKKKANEKTVWPKFAKAILLSTVGIGFVLLGFFGTQYLRSQDQREFFQEYQLVENLDLYQGTGDFDFLIELQKEDLFPQQEESDVR